MRVLRLLILVSALAGVGGTAALAQYPAPGGNILLVPSSPSPTTNATVSVGVTARDAAGKPIGAADCTAVLKSQPGNGASVLPASFKTSADGGATLAVQTGDKAGEVRVEVTCGTVSVGGVLLVTPVEAVAGVISPGNSPKPPNTGTGGSDDTSFPVAWFAGASAVLLGGVAALGFRRRRSS